jgi:hypothetical protein
MNMKKVFIIILLAAGSLDRFAQEDKLLRNQTFREASDTIRVGGIIIIKKGRKFR